MVRELVFILGGARSGKSDLAERLAKEGEHVLFVATAQAGDADMARRIETHQASRPDEWITLEEPIDLEDALRPITSGYDTVLVDCLTLWVSNLILKHEGDPNAESLILDNAKSLLSLYDESDARWIVVSNEVGQGIVPPYELGRVYRDALGRVNQLFAAKADNAYFMVAGLAMDLKRLGSSS